MVLCNVTKWFEDGTVYVDISQCNLTSSETSTTSEKTSEDDGALKFTVAVVMVYGIAAMGVLALGFFSRRKRHKELMDKEAGKFVKNFDNVKSSFEKKRRVGAVTSLLQTIHSPDFTPIKSSSISVQPNRGNLLSNLAFLAMPLTNIQEDSEIEISDEDNDVLKETCVSHINEEGENSSAISSILSNNIEINNNVSFSDESLHISKECSDNYLCGTDNEIEANASARGSLIEFEALKSETDTLLGNTQKKISDRLSNTCENQGSDEISNPDLILHQEDQDNVTTDDEVFLDETNDENYCDLELCSYPSRDHSPDWVDISNEKFFTV